MPPKEKKIILKTLANVMNGIPVPKTMHQRSITQGLASCLNTSDPELLWSMGLALFESKKRHQRTLGQGLLLSAALMGHKSALNNLSITLEQKESNRWQRKIAKVFLEIAAKNGDPIAMWNMYFTYKRQDPRRAIRWLIESSAYNKDYEKSLQRLLKTGKVSAREIRKLSELKPW